MNSKLLRNQVRLVRWRGAYKASFCSSNIDDLVIAGESEKMSIDAAEKALQKIQLQSPGIRLHRIIMQVDDEKDGFISKVSQ